MCVIDYICRFNKVPDEGNNMYLIDISLTCTIKKWRQDYIKLLIGLHTKIYEHIQPASVIAA